MSQFTLRLAQAWIGTICGLMLGAFVVSFGFGIHHLVTNFSRYARGTAIFLILIAILALFAFTKLAVERIARGET